MRFGMKLTRIFLKQTGSTLMLLILLTTHLMILCICRIMQVLGMLTTDVGLLNRVMAFTDLILTMTGNKCMKLQSILTVMDKIMALKWSPLASDWMIKFN